MSELHVPFTTVVLAIPTAVWALTFLPAFRKPGTIATVAAAAAFLLTANNAVNEGMSNQAGFLLPLVPLLLLSIIVVSPRSTLTPHRIRHLFSATVVTLAAFIADDLVVLAAFSALSALPIYFSLRHGDAANQVSGRVFVCYASVGALCLCAGAILLQLEATSASWATALIVLSVMIRQGIFPFHAWIPVTFEKASVGLSLLYTVPQLGALALLSETVDIPEVGVDILVILSLATAVLGGGQAILQTQSRRTLGYLILSGSGVVLAGIVAGHDARAGALILWMFSGIAVSGMGLTLWVIEKRKGTLLLSPFNGLYDRMPYLAVIFVLFGLGCSGFPGTPGYVGVELLLEGLGYRYPTLSLLLFVAIALSGIAIVRAYFGIFCGKRLPEANHYRVQRHEIIGFTLLVIPLLLAGFFPSLFLN